jgi:hypothetical protein
MQTRAMRRVLDAIGYLKEWGREGFYAGLSKRM